MEIGIDGGRSRAPLTALDPSLGDLRCRWLHRGRLQHAATGSVPLVIHFNGGSKVEIEPEWTLPWNAAAGATPVRLLQQSIYASFDGRESARATAAFEARVAFLDTRLRRTRGIGPLNFSCQAHWS